MRSRLLLLIALLCSMTAPVRAAAPTFGTDVYVVATVVETVITVADVVAGDALFVSIFNLGTAVRTYTFLDECGHTYPLIKSSPLWGTAVRNSAIFGVYASTCTDASLDITVTQSGPFAQHVIIAWPVRCSTSCAADTSSHASNTTATTHNASLDSTVIDTAADVLVASVCQANAALGTETDKDGAGTTWTHFPSDIHNNIFAQYRTATSALADERAEFTSSSARSTECVVVSTKENASGTPACHRGLLRVGC